ncbi:TspO and MBR related protein [Trichormus variabilis ATCC 29413]|uniref:TspO and MBR related protein n=2 Tax=Anabaena variabilis TaxID=264691 RepID=Q3MF24_TRIV2|nr:MULTISPECIES: TspO/MBR family protein [Nostocaceae]ABA20412.1 TspO and MBR related protein [Trichormus variabilis ATCC 29413]MBC1212609.1 TspO/MBR family protein [Trichormus variabilis ARAD]MBC1255205.1 TspO/MBR family protein [Trichormus variabilis V5]MBC1265547.1 TspO/MBR family protein [Trichormus variabilis FSR]MBC1300521.1 TspO/MBR family protein [Trichormus variabilis N2B]
MISSWLVIGAVTFLVAVGSFFITPRDVKWFAQLSRPRWLVFEQFIPLIWTVIFICGAASAYVVWEHDPGGIITWLLMGLYLLVEIITVTYIPLMLRFRSLKTGEIIGLSGFIAGIVLAIAVLPISGLASVLLIPYLVWSPIGTYTTDELRQLNPEDA